MLRKNDHSHFPYRYVNGSLGTIMDISEESLTVKLFEGEQIDVPKEKFSLLDGNGASRVNYHTMPRPAFMLKKAKSEQAPRMPNVRMQYLRQGSASAQERTTARNDSTTQYPIWFVRGMGDMAFASKVPYFTKSSLKKRIADPAIHRTIRMVAEKSKDTVASLFSIKNFLGKFVKLASDLSCSAIDPNLIDCTS